MINEIVTASGIPFRETQWVGHPPAGTYGIWTDDVEADGSDDMAAAVLTHSITIELYAPKPDPKAEQSIESLLKTWGLKWTKQSRLWLMDVQRYQTIYEFTYITKS